MVKILTGNLVVLLRFDSINLYANGSYRVTALYGNGCRDGRAHPLTIRVGLTVDD